MILENTGNEIIRTILEVLVLSSGPIAIVPHSNPDGDAIGSAYGLGLVLKNAGKEVFIITPNDYPDFLAWLNGELEIINYLKRKNTAEAILKRCKVMFCVDFNEIGRADEMEKRSLPFRVRKFWWTIIPIRPPFVI